MTVPPSGIFGALLGRGGGTGFWSLGLDFFLLRGVGKPGGALVCLICGRSTSTTEYGSSASRVLWDVLEGPNKEISSKSLLKDEDTLFRSFIADVISAGVNKSSKSSNGGRVAGSGGGDASDFAGFCVGALVTSGFVSNMSNKELLAVGGATTCSGGLVRRSFLAFPFFTTAAYTGSGPSSFETGDSCFNGPAKEFPTLAEMLLDGPNIVGFAAGIGLVGEV